MQLGIHAPTQGWTGRAQQTAAALDAEAFLWLAAERVTDAYPYTTALHIVRLANWATTDTPIGYTNAVAGTVNSWASLPGVVFQCGNEPDAEAGHNGEMFPQIAAAMRSRWPTILLANPPLRPENCGALTDETCEAADFIACHCYWQVNHPEDEANPGLGAAYRQLLDYGIPVIVTEVNAVPASGNGNDPNVPWDERNTQVADWAFQAMADGVAACCIYLADAAPDWAGFDVGPEAAADIRAQYDEWMDDPDPAPPPPEPLPDPRPPDGGGTMVSAQDVIDMASTQLYCPRSGAYDSLNGDHPWAYWCLAFVESTHRNLGLDVPPQSSAYQAGLSFDLNGGPAPLGAAMFFGQSFYYPDGHVAFSTGDDWCLGTVTNGEGVDYCYWNSTTNGYMGWTYYPGVTPADAPAPDPPPPTWLVQPGNPYQEGKPDEIGIGGGFLRYYNAIAIGQDPMVALGYARERECDAYVTDADGTTNLRTIQRFERATLIYQEGEPFPWDVVAALFNQQIANAAPLSQGAPEGDPDASLDVSADDAT